MKLSINIASVDCRPCSPTIVLRSPVVRPSAASACSASLVGFKKLVIIPRRPTTASSAGTPKRVKVAILAPTSSKLIPSCEATPTTLPRVGAKASASRLPSLTIAVKVSVAWAAVSPSFAYAWSTPVSACATCCVSPKPIAEAFAEASNTSVASAPRRPAEATVKSASLSACWLCPVAALTPFTEVLKLSRAFPVIPTRFSIFAKLLSKSVAIFTPAVPAAAKGTLTFLVMLEPKRFALAPKFFKLRRAIFRPLWRPVRFAPILMLVLAILLFAICLELL